eukprot:CAMPEP_0118661216 /NCGR_PEP_ID=MMETSP0785-20121206/16153_1 /TAXON_ID=91992 /ORGANISM="Bolidomonas pacifica, Strain CCMP 1866" /LENGTH=54 /DNA_ID=CAMNT_0006554625 /DNA_START=171 /DNA_END=335 /DNA_ORIENTATION=+
MRGVEVLGEKRLDTGEKYEEEADEHELIEEGEVWNLWQGLSNDVKEGDSSQEKG